MKRVLRILFFILLGLLGIVLLVVIAGQWYIASQSDQYMQMASEEAILMEKDGFPVRDLNKNGLVDIYEDPSAPVEARVEDLLSQMSVKEKAGMMAHTIITPSEDGELVEQPGVLNPALTSDLVLNRNINHFNFFQEVPVRPMVEWHNKLQKLAERTRLGIPITISSDPRHTYQKGDVANMSAENFSKWPDQLGFAAIGDSQLVADFGRIARQEYLALGIRTALHPMADLATEPRWTRINGTFGEDAQLAKKLMAAYVYGFQGDSLHNGSVACMSKHWPGGGPQKNGEDAHFAIGKEQVYPGGMFEYHKIPFEGAFEAGTAQIMPYYGLPEGIGLEEVGFNYNREVLQMLREEAGFEGVICSDWATVEGFGLFGFELVSAKKWGVEDLSPIELVKKSLDAGVDQFGGFGNPALIVELVESGALPESRLDESVRRLLKQKFILGLFDNPFLDEVYAAETVGKKEFQEAGFLAQKKSIVLLKNGDFNNKLFLPLEKDVKVYIENMDEDLVSQYANVVETVEEADMAILRVSTPYQPRDGFLERLLHQGDLDFKGEEKERILSILKAKPTVVDIYLDRAAVIPEISENAAALLANFGATDEALLAVLFGEFSPEGKLPIELPSSMEAVRNQKEDTPYDSKDPLYEFGFGLTYGGQIEVELDSIEYVPQE